MEFDRSPVWLALLVAGLSTLLSLGPALWLARVLELRLGLGREWAEPRWQEWASS